jgi:hypothetical protein
MRVFNQSVTSVKSIQSRRLILLVSIRFNWVSETMLRVGVYQ